MMNPDGVAWGHSRTNSLGWDLNRCYSQPEFSKHDVVAAVKVTLMEWASQNRLRWYMDMHAHARDRGCFLYGNMQPTEEEFFNSVAYGHAVQLNCPHLDIDKCTWSTSPGPKDDQPDYESGRGAIGTCCRVPLSYTLECNYNVGRLCRPVNEAPGICPHFQATQAVREGGVPRDPAAGGRFAPAFYDPCAWATVGEAMAVALLDTQADNPHSRLLSGRPPKLISTISNTAGSTSEAAQHPSVLERLAIIWETLTARHRQANSYLQAAA